MEVIELAWNVYLRTDSGDSLWAALVTGERFCEDLSRWQPAEDPKREVLAWLSDRDGLVVREEGLVLRVSGSDLGCLYDEWIEPFVDAIEPADVRTVKAERPEIGCRILGHEWAGTRCWRCGTSAQAGSWQTASTLLPSGSSTKAP